MDRPPRQQALQAYSGAKEYVLRILCDVPGGKSNNRAGPGRTAGPNRRARKSPCQRPPFVIDSAAWKRQRPVIAVIGTLLDSGITCVFQRRTTAYGEESARRERLRQERTDAYRTYAGALHNYRRMPVHRWFVEHEGPDEEDVPSLPREIHRLRSEAYEALFRVQPLTRAPELGEEARTALESATALHDKGMDRPGPDARRLSSEQAVEDFVPAAALHVDESATTVGGRTRPPRSGRRRSPLRR